MAIIIREDKVLGGKSYQNIKVYKSDKFPITSFDEQEAEKLDAFLMHLFETIYLDLQNQNLLDLRGTKGVINLWYYLGTKLQFIDDTNIIKPMVKKYVWKALWFHAKKIAPGEAKSRAGTQRDHFFYCYKLAKFDKEFVLSAGTWRDWMDFFDSPILSNRVFLNWFGKHAKEIDHKKIKNWLREFIKLIRNEFNNVDMTFLSEKEIYDKCDIVLVNFINSN